QPRTGACAAISSRWSPMTRQPAGSIAVIGGGSIGVAFAIVFAGAGRSVRLYEPDAARRTLIPGMLRDRLADLRAFDLLAETPDAVAQRVTVVDDLATACEDAVYVQE